MNKIALSGWNPGFNKVRLTNLLHARPEFSLADAKAATDAVLDGKLVTIAVPDGETESFIDQINSLGLRWSK